MNNVKISLTITLPGSVMVSEVDSLKRISDKKGNTKEVFDFSKNNKQTMQLYHKGKKEQIEIFIRKSKPAKQVINLPQEAYDQFTGDYIPRKYNGKWKSLTPMQKIRWHCQQIAEELGGRLEDFKVFD